MRSFVLAAGLLSALAFSAAAEDDRTAIDLPPDVKVQFLEHMRTHMNSLNEVILLMADGKMREAGSIARQEMAVPAGMGFGRYMPPEFRERGFEYHRSAAEFVSITAGIPEPPDSTGWAKVVNALGQITMQCNACHATFRVK